MRRMGWDTGFDDDPFIDRRDLGPRALALGLLRQIGGSTQDADGAAQRDDDEGVDGQLDHGVLKVPQLQLRPLNG